MAIEETYILPSGRAVKLRMPDLYAILASVGRVPSQQMIDVLNLLQAEGSLKKDEADEDRYLRKRNELRGMYAIAALCMVEPVLSLDANPPAGAWTPADTTYADLEVIYWSFFRGWRKEVAPGLIDAPHAEWAADTARDGDDLPPTA